MAKSLLNWSLKLGVTVALLVVIFRYIPFGAVIREMSAAHGGWILAAFLLSFVERLVASWRVKLLTDQLAMRLSIWKIFEINVVAIFYSTFLPGDLAGGAVRWYRMAKPGGHRAEAFAAIVFERLIDTVVLVLFGVLFWFWSSPPFTSSALDLFLLAFLASLLGAMVFITSPFASTVLGWTGRVIPWQKPRRFVLEKFEKVLVSVRTFRTMSPGGMALLSTLTVARHLLSVWLLVCFALALGMTVSIPDLGWIRSFVNIVMMLPVTLAGLGIREGTLVVALHPYGVPGSQAVALSLFLFSLHLAFAVAGGLVEVVNMFRRDRSSEMRPPSH